MPAIMRLSLRTCHRCTSLCHACDKADERRMQHKDPAYHSTPGPSGSSANRGAEDRAPLRWCSCAMAREERAQIQRPGASDDTGSPTHHLQKRLCPPRKEVLVHSRCEPPQPSRRRVMTPSTPQRRCSLRPAPFRRSGVGARAYGLLTPPQAREPQ